MRFLKDVVPYFAVWILAQWVGGCIWNTLFAEPWTHWVYTSITGFIGWHYGGWIARRSLLRLRNERC